MTDQELLDKFAAFIDGELPEMGDWVAAMEADRLLKVIDRQLLDTWLHRQAHTLLTNYITARRTHAKQMLARAMARGVFADAAERFTDGEGEALDPFAVRYVINAENVSRPLGDMTAADLLYAANEYHGQAQPLLMQEAFLRALAKRVKKGKTVRESVTVEQIIAMHADD